MKSLLLCILMFIGMFLFLKSNIFGLLDSDLVSYILYACLGVVICLALFMVGIPKFSDIKQALKVSPKKGDSDENKK